MEIFQLSSAIKICNKAKDVGLHVMFSTQTPGDGNCFYHAVVECLKHKSRPININHTDLRNSVVDYVRCNRISEFVTTWLQQNINCDLDFVLEKQGHEGEFANELFIRGTSLFLDIAILFTRSTSTLFFPYEVFWPMEPVPSNQSMENYTGEYILIGHNVNYFQSLYHHGKVHQCHHHISVLIRQDCMILVRFLTKE